MAALSAGGRYERRKPLRCDGAVAVREEAGRLLPIDAADVEPQPRPPSWDDVRRHVEALGVVRDPRRIFTARDLPDKADDAIAVVIVEIVREGALGDDELRVAAVHFARRSRERQTD